MRTVGIDERRARLGRRHSLVQPAPDVRTVTDRLVVLHATDPPTVYLSSFARLTRPSIAAIDTALYDTRDVVRMLGMRRTVFVVGRDLVAVVESACTQKIAATERRKLAKWLRESGIVHPNDWIDNVATLVVAELEARGEATARHLASAIADLNVEIVLGAGTKYESRQRANSHVLALLAAEGRIVRGRPSGAWTGTQYYWSTRDRWLGHELEALDPVQARADLARRWLYAFGPGTFDDLMWWTGWTASDTSATLRSVGVKEVDLDGRTGLLLPDDLEVEVPLDPWVALLPALDPTPMGWAGREWFLVEDLARALFDRSGNIGPTIWVNGRIVGGWAQRADFTIAVRLFEDLGKELSSLVEQRAEELAALLGHVRVTPKFRTPLERELDVR